MRNTTDSKTSFARDTGVAAMLVSAALALNFDGADFSGEAFNVFDGTTFNVTGTLDGDAVSLTATGGGETVTGTGTLARFPDGSPDEVQGTLEDGSSFSIVACRLNQRSPRPDGRRCRTLPLPAPSSLAPRG